MSHALHSLHALHLLHQLQVRLFYRRKKKDWNEVLRLSDYGTMDYFQ